MEERCEGMKMLKQLREAISRIAARIQHGEDYEIEQWRRRSAERSRLRRQRLAREDEL